MRSKLVNISQQELSYVYKGVKELKGEMGRILSDVKSQNIPNPFLKKRTESIMEELSDLRRHDISITDVDNMGRINNMYESVSEYPEAYALPNSNKIFE